MHLQYLVDAADKFMTEEHAIVEDYVLGTSFKILKISGARISTIYETRIRYANQYHCVDIHCSLALPVRHSL